MRKLLVVVVSIFLASLIFASVADARVYVRGYYRKDGTYVAPHYRSNPDGYFYNNWSTAGNINPYTGRVGTRYYPSYTYRPSYRSYSYNYYNDWNWYVPSYRSYSYYPSYFDYDWDDWDW
jgi:hypothetical protein